MRELILESGEWFSVNYDEELVIHDDAGPQRKYPPNLYCLEGDTVYLMFEPDDGTWELVPIPLDHTYVVDADGDLAVFDGDGDVVDFIEEGDFFIDQDTGEIYERDEMTEEDYGVVYFSLDAEEDDDDEFEDEFNLFEGLPYVEPNDTDGWRCGC